MRTGQIDGTTDRHGVGGRQGVSFGRTNRLQSLTHEMPDDMAPAALIAQAEATAEEPRQKQRRVRSELNLEQWSIWLPANSNRDPAPRVLTREISGENGQRIVAEVEITASRKGTLTTEDQRTYYALIEHHQKKGRPDNIVYFSLRGLAKALAKQWGSRTIETVTDSLTRLRANTLVWKNSYHDAETGRTQEELGFFNIITDLKIVTARQDGHVTRAEGYFKLNDAIIANIDRNHTKPVLLDVVINFKSEIAQILYTQLDRILSKDIATYERRTKELFADLGLEGRKYAYPSGRKQVLAPAIAELQNVSLTNGGYIRSATLERTADGKDFKIVVRRGRTKARIGIGEARSYEGQAEPHPQGNRPSEGRIEPKSEPTEAEPHHEIGKGSELLAYFHRVFFGTTVITALPPQKHRNLADWMIASHGEELARYIVDFAKREAEKTNFRIATFGAIANYIDRAVADYTLEQARIKRKEEARREAMRQAEADRVRQEREQLGYQLFRELAEEDRRELLGAARAELIRADKWRSADFSSDLNKLIFSKEAEELVRRILLDQINN